MHNISRYAYIHARWVSTRELEWWLLYALNHWLGPLSGNLAGSATVPLMYSSCVCDSVSLESLTNEPNSAESCSTLTVAKDCNAQQLHLNWATMVWRCVRVCVDLGVNWWAWGSLHTYISDHAALYEVTLFFKKSFIKYATIPAPRKEDYIQRKI